MEAPGVNLIFDYQDLTGENFCTDPLAKRNGLTHNNDRINGAIRMKIIIHDDIKLGEVILALRQVGKLRYIPNSFEAELIPYGTAPATRRHADCKKHLH